MRIVLALLATIVIVGVASAADIAKGPEVVDGIVVQYENQYRQDADVLIVSIIEATFTDMAPAYDGAFAANGRTADIIYDPAGVWGDTSPYNVFVYDTADDWWNTYAYASDRPIIQGLADDGMCFWLIGQDFAYGGGAANVTLLQNYFGVSSIIEDVNYNDATAMIWSGTAGGPLVGVADSMLPCFSANPWFSDAVTPLAQGLATWQTTASGGQWETGGVIDNRCCSLAVEFGCSNVITDAVGALLENLCGAPPIPAYDRSWGQIKHQYR